MKFVKKVTLSESEIKERRDRLVEAIREEQVVEEEAKESAREHRKTLCLIRARKRRLAEEVGTGESTEETDVDPRQLSIPIGES